MIRIRTMLLLLATVIGFGADKPVEPHFLEQAQPFPVVRDLALSPEGNEAYFTVQPPLGEIAVIMVMRQGLFGWKDAEIASFSGKYTDLEPFLANDGLRLYFASDRPKKQNKSDDLDFDIWYVERESMDAPWSEPVNMGAPINTEHNEFYPSLSSSGNLYFTTDRPGTLGKDDILFSALVDGLYLEPMPLDSAINSAGYEFNAFVAPDESYLIYTAYSRPDGQGSGDLYISYRDVTGKWSPAKNLGADINSPKMDYCPFVLNGSLYFTSRRSDIQVAGSGFTELDDLLAELNKHDNGQSRLYVTPFKEKSR